MTADMNLSMMALAYAAFAIGFYAWIVRSAKPVASPLSLWVNRSEEECAVRAA